MVLQFHLTYQAGLFECVPDGISQAASSNSQAARR